MEKSELTKEISAPGIEEKNGRIILNLATFIPKNLMRGFEINIKKTNGFVPLRRWHSGVLPYEFKVEHAYKNCNGKLVSTLELWARVEKEGEWSNRKNVKKPTRWNKSSGNQKIVAKYKIKDGWVWIKIRIDWDTRIPLTNLIIKRDVLGFSVPKGFIACWSKVQRHSPRCEFFLIPERIKPDKKLFFEMLGLYEAEGRKHSDKCSNPNHISFSNSDILLLKIFLDFIELFGVKRNKLGWFISFKDERLVNDIKRKVVNKLGLSLEKCSKYVNKSANKPTITIYITNCFLKAFILNIFKKLKTFIRSDKEASLEYLKGLWAGDGSLTFSKDHSIWGVLVTGNERIHDYIMTLLSNIGINSKISESNIELLGGWETFMLLRDYDFFSLKPMIKKQFNIGLLNHRSTKKLKGLLIFEENNHISSRFFGRKLNMEPRYARRKLLWYYKHQYLNRKRSKEFMYFLTPKGKQTINFLKELSGESID